MRKRITTLHLCLSFALHTLAAAGWAQATLGEPADSVELDRKAFSAVRHPTLARNAYTIKEFESAANTVREFISPSGVVFAFAWNGLSKPDLTILLGAYVGEYEQALRHTEIPRGRLFSQVKASRVIVETWGHMRNLQGRAYIPALIPSGVSVNEIK
jgi:hypothetical protein